MSMSAGEPRFSRARGIVLFCALVAAGGLVAFLAFRSAPAVAPSGTGGGVPLAAPSSTPQSSEAPTASPTVPAAQSTPTPSATPDPQRTEFLASHIPTDTAMAVALAMTELDWRSTPQRAYLRIRDVLDPDIRDQVRTAIEAQDWAGCRASKCVIVPEATKVEPTATGSRGWRIAVTVTPYLNGKIAQPARVIAVTMSRGPGGAWRAVDVQSS